MSKVNISDKVQKELKKIIKYYKLKSIADVDWSYISEYEKLSEQFIEKYRDMVSWFHISYYQKLSE